MRKPVVFSFEYKILALSTLKALGIAHTTRLFSRLLSYEAIPMREALETLNRCAVLLDCGLIEKNMTGAFLFVEIHCPQQPTLLTVQFLNKCKPEQQSKFQAALDYLHLKQNTTSVSL